MNKESHNAWVCDEMCVTVKKIWKTTDPGILKTLELKKWGSARTGTGNRNRRTHGCSSCCSRMKVGIFFDT